MLKTLSVWLALTGSPAHAPAAAAADRSAPEGCEWRPSTPHSKLACMTADGGWIDVRLPQGFDETTLARANAGEVAAMTALGVFYAAGPARQQDPKLAYAWLRKAADQDDPEATNRLGLLYSFGDGVARDPAEAARLWRKAAQAGHPVATANLADVYVLGDGVPVDYVEAVRLYRIAANLGNRGAMETLAHILEGGWYGVAKDEAEAARWFRAAAATPLPSGL